MKLVLVTIAAIGIVGGASAFKEVCLVLLNIVITSIDVGTLCIFL